MINSKISSNYLWFPIGSLCMKITPILTFQEVDKNRKINCVDIMKGALCYPPVPYCFPLASSRNPAKHAIMQKKSHWSSVMDLKVELRLTCATLTTWTLADPPEQEGGFIFATVSTNAPLEPTLTLDRLESQEGGVGDFTILSLRMRSSVEENVLG